MDFLVEKVLTEYGLTLALSLAVNGVLWFHLTKLQTTFIKVLGESTVALTKLGVLIESRVRMLDK